MGDSDILAELKATHGDLVEAATIVARQTQAKREQEAREAEKKEIQEFLASELLSHKGVHVFPRSLSDQLYRMVADSEDRTSADVYVDFARRTADSPNEIAYMQVRVSCYGPFAGSTDNREVKDPKEQEKILQALGIAPGADDLWVCRGLRGMWKQEVRKRAGSLLENEVESLRKLIK